jgi:cation:H+ antiporter
VHSYLLLLAGVACAAIGGELFVRGAVGLARWARVSPGIIAVTVVAFATSSPELSVAVNSALENEADLALGNAVGANVVNVALILALALLIAPIRASRGSVRRDFRVALLVPAGTALLLLDGELSRIDGALMLIAFACWLAAAVLEARQQRRSADGLKAESRHGLALAFSAAGFALLAVAGDLIVDGARAIAQSYGLSDFVIGATIVAIGTTVPELATAVVSKLRGEDELGLGTILGSNIFNGMFIIGVAATISPIRVSVNEALVALAVGTVAVALTFPSVNGLIGRSRGWLLLTLYAGYVALVLA